MTRAEAARQLKTFITNDINQLLSLERGGNYAVALLITIGSEALSKLEGKATTPTTGVFRELVKPYGLNAAMADDLFEALRKQLAHVYDTKLLKVGRHEFGIYVGWGAYEHMSILRDRDPHGLYLNVRTMWGDFERILEDKTKQFANDHTPIPREVREATGQSIAGWRRLFDVDGGKGES